MSLLREIAQSACTALYDMNGDASFDAGPTPIPFPSTFGAMRSKPANSQINRRLVCVVVFCS